LNIFVTGRPGVGKTSVVQRTMQALAELGYEAGGAYCPEIRVGATRVGFEVIDLKTGRKGILAHVNQPDGPRVGRYTVNLHDLSEVGAGAIIRAMEEADYIVIDEVGPMELHSRSFREAVTHTVEGPKPVLGILHHRLQDPLINNIKNRKDTAVYEVTPQNRESLHNIIAELIARGIERLKA
jgi:nucleoside-triphosphatase